MRIFFILFMLAISLGSNAQENADLILHNGRIYTLDSAFSIHQAIAIRNGKILATGPDEVILKSYQSDKTEDLNGKFVYPGLIDAHCHFIGYAEGLRRVDLRGTTSFEEVVDRVKKFAAETEMDFIYGRGWDQNDWAEKQWPDKTKLDEMFPNTPVVLSRIDGHALLVNQAAIDFSGIADDTTVDGGIVMKDKNGKPTGIFIDNAESLVKVPELPRNELIAALQNAEANCFAYGLTTLTDAGLEFREVKVIDSLQKAGLLKMRMYIMVSDDTLSRRLALENGKIDKPRLQMRSFKFYADGALGSRGACLLEEYHDAPGHHGLLLSDPQHFRSSAQILADAGFQMNTHAIGDSANRIILQAYGKYTLNGDLRWRIEHAQVVNENDFDLFGRYNVIPSVQPTHATSDMYWAEERLGPQRIEDAYAYKRLLEEYGKIALGTDFPVEEISTLKTYYAATARKDDSGYPEGGFQAENALSRKEALLGMTLWAAYANFEEDVKGSLESGKYADLVIMDTDLLTCEEDEILKTKILATYINGEKVYSK